MQPTSLGAVGVAAGEDAQVDARPDEADESSGPGLFEAGGFIERQFDNLVNFGSEYFTGQLSVDQAEALQKAYEAQYGMALTELEKARIEEELSRRMSETQYSSDGRTGGSGSSSGSMNVPWWMWLVAAAGLFAVAK